MVSRRISVHWNRKAWWSGTMVGNVPLNNPLVIGESFHGRKAMTSWWVKKQKAKMSIRGSYNIWLPSPATQPHPLKHSTTFQRVTASRNPRTQSFSVTHLDRQCCSLTQKRRITISARFTLLKNRSRKLVTLRDAHKKNCSHYNQRRLVSSERVTFPSLRSSDITVHFTDELFYLDRLLLP